MLLGNLLYLEDGCIIALEMARRCTTAVYIEILSPKVDLGDELWVVRAPQVLDPPCKLRNSA